MGIEINSEKVFTTNRLSASILIDVAKAKFFDKASHENQDYFDRYVIAYDLYVKVVSYARINKIFFWLAFIFGLSVLVWPSLAIIGKDFGFEKDFLKSAIVQTTITCLAALNFAIYSHYKKRQILTENLMRLTIFSKEENGKLIETIISEMAKIDQGFSFSNAVFQKGKTTNSERI